MVTETKIFRYDNIRNKDTEDQYGWHLSWKHVIHAKWNSLSEMDLNNELDSTQNRHYNPAPSDGHVEDFIYAWIFILV